MHLPQMSWDCACEIMQESTRLETHGAADSCRFELTHSGGWPTYARPVVEHVTWQRRVTGPNLQNPEHEQRYERYSIIQPNILYIYIYYIYIYTYIYIYIFIPHRHIHL